MHPKGALPLYRPTKFIAAPWKSKRQRAPAAGPLFAVAEEGADNEADTLQVPLPLPEPFDYRNRSVLLEQVPRRDLARAAVGA